VARSGGSPAPNEEVFHTRMYGTARVS
jgi:hypothetical protein